MQQRLADRSPFFYGWWILGAAGTANFARNAAASLTISVFIYPLSEELGWSRTLIAGAAAAGGLAATFTSPIIGRMIDRYGARSVLTVSIVVLCISTFALAWSDVSLTVMGATIPWVFYIAYGTGRVIFASPVQIGTSVVVSRWFIRMRGRTNGILGLSHSAGMVLFPLIASIVIAQSGWRDAWFVLSVVVFVVALLPVALLISEQPEDLGLRPDGDDLDESNDENQGQDAKSASIEEPNWTSKDAMRTPALWLLANRYRHDVLHARRIEHSRGGVLSGSGIRSRDGGNQHQSERDISWDQQFSLGSDRRACAGAVCDDGGCVQLGDRGIPVHAHRHGD